MSGLVFILPDTAEVSAVRCNILYSVSHDATSCVWKLIPTSDGKGLTGLKLAQISGQHNKGISACAWDAVRRQLMTAGLDGLVRVYDIQTSLARDADGSADTASGYDLASFKRAAITFNTSFQPINAMVLAENKIFVGCWNGAIHQFNPEKPTMKKVCNPVILLKL